MKCVTDPEKAVTTAYTVCVDVTYAGEVVPADEGLLFQDFEVENGARFSVQMTGVLRLDMEGSWIGHGHFEGYEYSVRLIVFSDEDGEALWRGVALPSEPAVASDEPRFHICEAVLQGKEKSDSALEERATPPETMEATTQTVGEVFGGLRPENRLCGVATNMTVGEVVDTHEAGRVGDELPVGGQLQWHLEKDSFSDDGSAYLEDTYGEDDVGGPRMAVEYVCGLYSPSTRKLTLGGTHKSYENSREIDMDLYDIELDMDGLCAQGFTLGSARSPWVNELKLQTRSADKGH